MAEKMTPTTWWNSFITGVLATAVGVGLTFGVNNYVAHQNQKKAQRLTAMMAIYDIDQIVDNVTKEKQRQDAFYEVAMYLFTHQDELDNFSADSLRMTLNYLQYFPFVEREWADESSEKVFTTSMDAMMHIGDVTFYDNVQECYRRRRLFLDLLQNNVHIRKPVPYEFVADFRKQCQSSDLDPAGEMTPPTMARLIRLMFQLPEVTPFMQQYVSRYREYQDFITNLSLLNQENKFLMNISDEDMERYIKEHINKTMPATPKLLLGTWENKKSDKVQIFEFRKDNTVLCTASGNLQLSLQLYEEGLLVSMLAPLTYSMEGTWELANDTLVILRDTATTQMDLELDLSKLPKSFLERKSDSIHIFDSAYHAMIFNSIKMQNARAIVEPVSISKTGSIMFWEDRTTLPWGEEHIDKTALIKKKD